MRKIMFLLCLALVSWGANAQHDHAKMDHTKSGQSMMQSKMTGKMAISPAIKVEHSQSATAIINNYLALKDALVEDNSKKAASAGKMLFEALSKFNLSAQSKSQQKELKDIIDDARENTEHIVENSGKIDHQREHFEILGTDIKDLIVITGSDRNLYQLYCPMYNNHEGGKWLSASNKVKNPFLGSKMLNCGNVKQEITVK